MIEMTPSEKLRDNIHTQRYIVLEELKSNLYTLILTMDELQVEGIKSCIRVVTYMQDLEYAKRESDEVFENQVKLRLGEFLRYGK